MSTMFSSNDFRGRFEDSLTTEQAWDIGKAFADWLPEDGHVVVVSDIAAAIPLVKAVIEGLRLQGRGVIDGGQGDEQTLIQISVASQTAGGVLLTHSDLEGIDIIRLYQENAVAVTADNGLTEITDLIEAGNFVPAAIKGELTSAV